MVEAGKRTIHTGGEQIEINKKIGGEFKVQQMPDFIKDRLKLFDELYQI